jgi:hypothetical protein
MPQAPITVWNEVRITSDGISISLLSESRDGPAIVEDEAWFTFDELESMAPSEPLSLNLSDQSQNALDEQSENATVGNLREAESMEEKADEMPENPSADELLAYMEPGGQQSGDSRESVDLQVGDVVRDTRPPDGWRARLEVVGISDKSAHEYVIEERFAGPDETVANANPSPSCDPDEPVVEAVYRSDMNLKGAYDEEDVYAFPESRLEEV